jgi:hypothetical protein
LEGFYGQTNNANVTSTISVGTVGGIGTHGSVLAQGTAVGNSATFIAQRVN